MNRTWEKAPFAAKPYQNAGRPGIKTLERQYLKGPHTVDFRGDGETGCGVKMSLSKGKNAPNKSLLASGIIQASVKGTACSILVSALGLILSTHPPTPINKALKAA